MRSKGRPYREVGLDGWTVLIGERAVQLAAFYSKAQNTRGKVEVHVCRAADMRKPRGAPAGLVELRRWEALKVYPKGLEGGEEEAGNLPPHGRSTTTSTQPRLLRGCSRPFRGLRARKPPSREPNGGSPMSAAPVSPRLGRALSPLPGLLAALLFACDDSPTKPPRVAAITLTPVADTLIAGDSARFTAQATDPDGQPLADASLTWSIDDSTVARIDAGGWVTARTPGTATLTVAADVVYAAARLVVLPIPVVSCATGVPRAGATIDTATWSAAHGPYCVQSNVVVARRLTMEAGTRVYGATFAGLDLGPGALLEARGTADAPVLLAPLDSTGSWRGISTPSAGCTSGTARDTVVLQHAWLRQTNLGRCAARISITESRLDTTILDVAGGGELSVERSALHMTSIHCSGDVSVMLHGVRIEGNNGPAIFLHPTCPLLDATGVRAVGNDHIADLTGEAAQTLLSEPGAADSLAGNQRDRIHLHAGAGMHVAGELALPGFEYVGSLELSGAGVLRLAPGALLNVGYLRADSGVRVVARGTPAAPVVISGDPAYAIAPVEIGGLVGAPSLLSNVRLENAKLVATPGRPLYLDSARVVGGGRVELRAPGSRITASVFDSAAYGYASDSTAVVVGTGDTVRSTIVRRTAGVGMRIEGAAVIDSCEVTGSGGDGIVVTSAAGATIHHCSLHDNAGVGVRNLSADTLDARFNWWGDPAGPNPPAGDGVAGPVDWSSPLGLAIVLSRLLQFGGLP